MVTPRWLKRALLVLAVIAFSLVAAIVLETLFTRLNG